VRLGHGDRLRIQLEGGIQALLVALVVWVALASSNVSPWNVPIGRTVRWVALAVLLAFALAYAVTARRKPPAVKLGAPGAFAAGLVTLAVASSLWSSDPSLTLGRSASLVVLVLTAGALAYGTRGCSEAVGYILLGLLAGAVLVALGGLINLWADPDRALVPATVQSPSRYNGLGANPNTMAMLLAVALPLSVWAGVEARSRVGRLLAAGAFLLLDGSIVASGSRGALIGATAGLLVLAFALVPTTKGRVAAASAVVALLAANAAAMQVPQPAERDPTAYLPEFGQRVRLGARDAQFILPLEGEIDVPTKPFRRSIFDTSGRTQAWGGAVDQIAERPLLGYGFGTEERVFVDRFALFVSDRVENSFLGTALQLGLVGLGLVCAFFAACILSGARAFSAPERDRRVAGACGAVVAAGLVVALTQSFLTSVGSTPTAAVWISAFLLAAIGGVQTEAVRAGASRSASAAAPSTAKAR
jgi:exopolysaccharide production protein ExoQ